MDLCEFEASLVYRVSSNTAKDTHRNPVSKNQKRKELRRMNSSLYGSQPLTGALTNFLKLPIYFVWGKGRQLFFAVYSLNQRVPTMKLDVIMKMQIHGLCTQKLDSIVWEEFR